MSANLEDPAVTKDWTASILIPIPKKGSTKECSNHQTIVLTSHATKVILKILHARLQHYVNLELADVQAGFRKGRGTRDINSLDHRESQGIPENIYLCFIDCAKAFDCMDHNKLWKLL